MDADTRQAEQTFQMIECGNVQLHNPIQYGILLLGNTKAGKTTSAQHLMNQVLVGYKANQDRIFYKIQESKYKAAEIGEHERISKTQIPNLFEIKMGEGSKGKIEGNKKKSFLIDCPGYIDTYGCYRIISNRFFHYLVFSKVEKIKFVLTFSYNDMEKACSQMIKTFKEFLKGFRKFPEIKDKVIAATSIMITSVPPKSTRQQVIEVFKGSAENVGSDFSQAFLSLKQNIIANKKVHIFHKAEPDKVCPKTTILEQLMKQGNQTGKFWVRSLDKNEEADMTHVQISLADYSIEDPKLFDQQIKILSKFYEAQILKQVKSFIQILGIFAEDNKAGGEKSQFLNKILEKTAENAKWRSEKSACYELYKSYSEKRNVVKNVLFKPETSQKPEKSEPSWSEIPFWLCKMKTFMKIQEFSGKVSSEDEERDLNSLKMRESIVKEILTLFLNLGKKKKQKSAKADQQKNEQLLNYAYQVYKDINISNKLYNLVYEQNFDLNSQKIKKLEKNVSFILMQYPATIKSMFLKLLQTSSIEMLMNNLGIIQAEENLSGNGAAEIAKFLVVVMNRLEKYELEKKQEQKKQAEKTPQAQNVAQHVSKKQKKIKIEYDYIKQDLAKRRIKFLFISLEAFRKQVNPSLSKLVQMQQLRQETSKKIQKIAESKTNHWEELVALNNKVVQLMAEFVEKNGHYDLAIKLYDSIFDSNKIFEILDIKEEKVRKLGKKPLQMLEILTKYMKMAQKYHRIDLALQKGFDARHYAIDASHTEYLNSTNQFLKETCKSRDDDPDPVYDFLFNQGGQAQIDNKTRDQVLKLARQAKNQSPEKKTK